MKSALSLIFAFISLIFVVAAVAEESQKVHVDYSLSRMGSRVCQDAKIVLAEEEVLLCEGTNTKNNNKVYLKATVKKVNENSFQVSARVEEVNSDNVIKVVSSPSFETVANENSEMTSSTGGAETTETKLSLTVNTVL